jgi:hypothetical protein
MTRKGLFQSISPGCLYVFKKNCINEGGEGWGTNVIDRFSPDQYHDLPETTGLWPVV